jgi:hypothetical protein
VSTPVRMPTTPGDQPAIANATTPTAIAHPARRATGPAGQVDQRSVGRLIPGQRNPGPRNPGQRDRSGDGVGGAGHGTAAAG